jgi:hypothetical protein
VIVNPKCAGTKNGSDDVGVIALWTLLFLFSHVLAIECY